jgi:hypothetical protein
VTSLLQDLLRGACLALGCVALACSDSEEPCGTEACAAQPLENSELCLQDGGCPRLEQLSQGCTGSVAQQRCTLCGFEFTRVVIDESTDAYFEASGALGAVDVRGQPGRVCSWYGADLFGCTPIGEVEQVPCEGAPR